MIAAGQLISGLVDRGITAVTGVPCSYLTPVINRAISDPAVRYLPAAQEGDAAALAAGAWLGGGLGCVISQNSGLGNMVNPITSLLQASRIPALLMVTWRGQPGLPDEPQHELMGEITPALVDLMRIDRSLLPADPQALAHTLDLAWAQLRQRRSYAVLIERDTVAPEALHEPVPVAVAGTVHGRGAGQPPARMAALERLLAAAGEQSAIVSTTGKTSRELYTIADREQHFYLVGAMGAAGPVGLGVALHTPRPVIVVDGDGAVLMRLGSLAMAGAFAPRNLVHVVLDNGVHDSTGGQRTLAGCVDLPSVAAACGYRAVYRCAGLDGLDAALAEATGAGAGPSLVYLPVQPGSVSGLGRPKVAPSQVAQRFREFVCGSGRRAANGSAANSASGNRAGDNSVSGTRVPVRAGNHG